MAKIAKKKKSMFGVNIIIYKSLKLYSNMYEMQLETDTQQPSSLNAVFQIMKTNTALLKLGRSGKPHFRYFHLSEDRSKLIWQSDKKSAANTESIQILKYVISHL